jgi:hypothetical protein
MTPPTAPPRPPRFAFWRKLRGGRWHVLAEGRTFAEAFSAGWAAVRRAAITPGGGESTILPVGRKP